jgi:hypothetical protein
MKIYSPKSIIFPEGNARGEYDTRGWIIRDHYMTFSISALVLARDSHIKPDSEVVGMNVHNPPEYTFINIILLKVDDIYPADKSYCFYWILVWKFDQSKSNFHSHFGLLPCWHKNINGSRKCRHLNQCRPSTWARWAVARVPHEHKGPMMLFYVFCVRMLF